MGELIIHIDQETGTVLRVEQKLDAKDKRIFSEKSRNEVSFNMLRLAEQVHYQRVEKLQKRVQRLRDIEKEISQWCCTKDPEYIVTLEPLGNLFHDDPEVVKAILEHRDTFQRFVSLPVELWEKRGNTVCTVDCAGVPYECYH